MIDPPRDRRGRAAGRRASAAGERLGDARPARWRCRSLTGRAPDARRGAEASAPRLRIHPARTRSPDVRRERPWRRAHSWVLMGRSLSGSRCAGPRSGPVPSSADDVLAWPTVTDRRRSISTTRRRSTRPSHWMVPTSIPTRSCRCGRWWAEWTEVAPNEPAAVVLATADVTDDRRPAPSWCVASTTAGSRSSRATRAARPPTSPPTPTARPVQLGAAAAAGQLRGPVAQVARAESEAYFAGAPAGQPARGVGVAPVQRAGRSGRARGPLRRGRGALRRATCPARRYWGGYRLVPDVDRALAGPAHRLHDRLRYERGGRRLADRAPQPVGPGPGRAAATRPVHEVRGVRIGALGGQIGPARARALRTPRRQLELHAAARRRLTGLRGCTPRSSRGMASRSSTTV